MANLPVNKDHFSGEYVGEVLRLDEKQVKQIEAGAKLKLTNALIAELSFAIDNYIISSGKAARAVSGGKTRRKIRALKKNLDAAQAFFSDSSSPEAKDALQKIESALWFVSKTDREQLRKTPGLPREEHKKLTDPDTKKTFVDTARFQVDLIYLRHAAGSAMDRLERESKAQKSSRISGSKKEAAFDRFLEDLELIYKRATHVRGTFIEFLLAVHEMMPPANRPRMPNGWGDTPKEHGKKSSPRK
jgi:hypothetical protein